MKVLMTGATGLLGGHLLPALQQRGEEIRALVLPGENFDAIADEVGGKRSTRHLPYMPLYYGSMVEEKVAHIMHTKPIVTRLGVMMLGTDNKHSVEKARRELGYEPQVDLREGISLAAAWFNAGGMDRQLVNQANQYAPLAGVRKL
jgi:nucleoside-diphosphate-sugar epimerase